MKLIGLLGGTSWPSTFTYYDYLNRAAQKKFGGAHSARLLLYSVDYHPFKSLYDGQRDKIPPVLEKEIRFLIEKKPDGLILCNNSLHKYLDMLKDHLELSIPVFHAGKLSAEKAVQTGCKKILLLGTSFTMEDGFFAAYFTERGVEVVTPSAEDRQTIQSIQTKIALGENPDPHRPVFGEMLKRYKDVDAIVLACTELPLVIDARNAPKPLINPIDCQCEAAAAFAFVE